MRSVGYPMGLQKRRIQETEGESIGHSSKIGKSNHRLQAQTGGHTAARCGRARAVNNDGRFGRWSYHFVRQPPDLLKLLDRLVSAKAA